MLSLGQNISSQGHAESQLPRVAAVVVLSRFSRVQLFAILCSPPGSSIHGILQARTLAWVSMASSRGSSRLRGETHVPYVLLHWQAGSLPPAPPGEAQRSRVTGKNARAQNADSVADSPGCSGRLCPDADHPPAATPQTRQGVGSGSRSLGGRCAESGLARCVQVGPVLMGTR